MRLFESSTFQFCLIILIVAGIAALNNKITWSAWLDASIYFVGIYAGKEGVEKGANAYKQRKDGIRRD